MPVIVLAGSTATYNGKTKGWEHRFKKKCTVQKDTRTSSPTYPVIFDGEDKVVHVNFDTIDFTNKRTKEIEALAA